MKQIFAVGDIHGEALLLEKMLERWQKKNEQLVILGDMIDRGENPGAVLRKVKKLYDHYDVVVLKGNHEQMLLDWLAAPDEKMAYYASQGGMETIQTLLRRNIPKNSTPSELAIHIKEEAAEWITFIENLPLYYEVGKYVFVHAGVDLTKKDWRNSKPTDFCWIREPFLFGENKTGKVFIFGHTPVQNLHKDGSGDIWISEDKTRLDIDGGAVFGGQLNAIVANEQAITAVYKEQK